MIEFSKLTHVECYPCHLWPWPTPKRWHLWPLLWPLRHQRSSRYESKRTEASQT